MWSLPTLNNSNLCSDPWGRTVIPDLTPKSQCMPHKSLRIRSYKRRKDPQIQSTTSHESNRIIPYRHLINAINLLQIQLKLIQLLLTLKLGSFYKYFHLTIFTNCKISIQTTKENILRNTKEHRIPKIFASSKI